MKLKTFLLGIILCSCLCGVLAQDSSATKRRKLRKKPSDQATNESSTISNTNPAITFEDSDDRSIKPSPPEVDSDKDSSDERSGRGFLDEYYSKFDERVEKSQVDKSRANERIDLSGGVDGVELPENSMFADMEDLTNDVTMLKAEHRTFGAEEYRKFPTDLSVNSKAQGMKKSPLSMLAEHIFPEKSESGYVQQLSIPKQKTNMDSYMISAMPVNDVDQMEMVAKAKRKNMNAALQPPTDKYEMSGLESLLMGNPSPEKNYNSIGSPSLDSLSYEAPTVDTRDPMSKFFGLTGTTSKDIQLGLTFTVPFMSIPLTAISSMLNGEGLSDMMNFNFGTSAIVTVVILGIILVFVLPQVIYWLTGVNLSAFSWGRNDDGHGIQLTDLAHNVDEALLKYDIDIRNCLARTTCVEYKGRKKDSRTVGRLSRGLLENLAENQLVKTYLGETRLNEAIERGSGDTDCYKHYSNDVCPWDPPAMMKIATKIMTSGNLDWASIASMAASAAAAVKSR